MDIIYYEDLLNKIISSLYGNKITVDKKGMFEWGKSNEGIISYRSIEILHEFDDNTSSLKQETTTEQKSKVSYGLFKNSFYISEMTDKNTVDIYNSGGGMVKRYTFQIKGSEIKKLKDIVILIC